MKPKAHPLLGKYFHSFEITHGIRRVVWQGRIEAVTEEGALVQLFEWLLGEPSAKRWIARERLAELDLYDTIEDMREAYETRLRHPTEQAARRLMSKKR